MMMAVHEPRTIRFAIYGPIAREDLSGLSDRICRLLMHSAASIAFCDVHGIAADAVTVDALARLQLAAHRHGCRVRLQRASSDLRDLVDLIGLTDVLLD